MKEEKVLLEINKPCHCSVKDIKNAFGDWIGVEQFWCAEHSKDVMDNFKLK